MGPSQGIEKDIHLRMQASLPVTRRVWRSWSLLVCGWNNGHRAGVGEFKVRAYAVLERKKRRDIAK